MKYCSECGAPVELGIPDGDSFKRYICTECSIIHYSNPKMIVGCLPVWENKILLCKRAIEPRFGYWTLPAGYLENQETVEEGAIRETKEEANAEVEIIKLHSVYSIPHINQIYMFFLSKLLSPDYSPSLESSEVDLFELDQIPWDELAFSSVKFALEKFLNESDDEFTPVHLGTFGRRTK